MTGSIVCGVDGSESARGAASVGRELAARLGLPLVFVRAVEEGASGEEIDAVASRLQELAEDAAGVDGGARWRVETGHAADRLLAAARKEDAVLIVVGSTGPRSSLLGSVSADVSRRAPCPVVVVAPGADRPLAGSEAAVARAPRFAGLFDDGYRGDAGMRVGRGRGFAGGIVRFDLGGGG